MKIAVIIFSIFLAAGCTKRDRISDFEPGPNTSVGKDGREAGEGSSSSLGSQNPSTPESGVPDAGSH